MNFPKHKKVDGKTYLERLKEVREDKKNINHEALKYFEKAVTFHQ